MGGVSWYEANAYAEFMAKACPLSIIGTMPAAFTWLRADIIPFSNFGQAAARVGSHEGMSGFGTYDMAGNVKEWCWNEDGHHKRYILGKGRNESDYMFGELDAYFPMQRSANFGFRCVKYSTDTPDCGDRAADLFCSRL